MTETVQDNEESQQELSDDRRSDWSSPGEKLKKLREERGLSHHRVAEALHMTAHYVKSLESDQYQKLPGKTFVKGYFKAYARLLDADVDEVMQCYEQYVSALEETQENEAEEILAKKSLRPEYPVDDMCGGYYPAGDFDQLVDVEGRR